MPTLQQKRLLFPLAAAAAGLPTANLLGEWRFDEASGQLLNNRVNVSPPTITNLFAGPEQVFSGNLWTKSGPTTTDYYATDPLGNANASRYVTTSGTGKYLSQSVMLPAGQHTLSLWVKSNTGADQTFRMSLDNSATLSSALTAPASGWARVSYTATVSAGTTGRIPIFNNAAGDALDILIYGAQLESGSSASSYAAQAFDATLGKTGAADTADPSWSTGYLGFQGSKYALGLRSAANSLSQVSLYSVFRWTGTPVLAGYAPILSEDYNANRLLLSGDDGGKGYPFGRFSSAAASPYLANLQDGNWHVAGLTYDGATLRYYIDGVEVASTASASVAAVAIQRLYFGNANFSGYWPGDQAYALLYSTGHDAATVRSITNTLRTSLAVRSIAVNTISKFVVVEGDSITDSGFAASKGYSYLGLRAITPVVQGRNFAVSGSTLTNLNSRAASVDALYDGSRSKNILSVLIGRNDLLGAGSASAFVASLKTYCQARKATGWTILLCTILPSTASGFNTVRNSANSLIAGDTSFYDALADFAAESHMGPDAAASDTSLYSDGTHPTATGQGYLKTVWQAAVTGVL